MSVGVGRAYTVGEGLARCRHRRILPKRKMVKIRSCGSHKITTTSGNAKWSTNKLTLLLRYLFM